MARQVNGSTSVLETPKALVSGMPLTLEAWVMILNTTGSDQCILGISRALSGGDFSGFTLVVLNGLTVRCRMIAASGTSQAATTTAVLTLGRWHHIAATFTSTTSRAVYIDGGNKATNASNPGAQNGLTFTHVGALHNNNVLSQFANALIAYPVVRNVVLNDNEISQMAASRSPGWLYRPDTVMDGWALNGGAGEIGTRGNFLFPTASGLAQGPPQVQNPDPPQIFTFGRVVASPSVNVSGMFFAS